MTGLDIFKKIIQIDDDIQTLDFVNQDIADKDLSVMKSNAIQRAITLMKKEKEDLKSLLAKTEINS